MSRPPISPCDCPHDRTLFVASHRSTPAPERSIITVCEDCGEFRVIASLGSVTIVTTFELPTQELVEAAGQYVRMLDAGDGTRKE